MNLSVSIPAFNCSLQLLAALPCFPLYFHEHFMMNFFHFPSLPPPTTSPHCLPPPAVVLSNYISSPLSPPPPDSRAPLQSSIIRDSPQTSATLLTLPAQLPKTGHAAFCATSRLSKKDEVDKSRRFGPSLFSKAYQSQLILIVFWWSD